MEQQKKKPGASDGGASGSRGVSKISARPGGNSIGTAGRRGLGASTASTRNASRGAAGGRRGVLGKGKGGAAAAGLGGWGEEEESALKGLAEKLGVVRKTLKTQEFCPLVTISLLLFFTGFFPRYFSLCYRFRHRRTSGNLKKKIIIMENYGLSRRTGPQL